MPNKLFKAKLIISIITGCIILIILTADTVFLLNNPFEYGKIYGFTDRAELWESGNFNTYIAYNILIAVVVLVYIILNIAAFNPQRLLLRRVVLFADVIFILALGLTLILNMF